MAHFYARLSFIVGIVLGVFLAFLVKRPDFFKYENIASKLDPYSKWFENLALIRIPFSWDDLRYSNNTYYTESEYLFNNIRLLCIIMTKNNNNLDAAYNTWAKGCNKVIPVKLDTKNKIMPIKQSKDKSSWPMLCNCLDAIETKDFDWILIVKDTTYVITENLRHFVAPLKSEQNYYLGHAVKFWSTVYNSADPGYVLSRGTLESFQDYLSMDKCSEIRYFNKEDLSLGRNLAQLNITPINTVDEEGLSTFHPYNWYHLFYPGENYYKTSVFPVKCCSKRSIAFQSIEGDKMYTFNYLFYKLQLFTGGSYGNRPYKDDVPDDKTWKDFLKQQNVRNENISSEEYYKLWENLINDPSSFVREMKKEQLFDYD